MEELYYITEFEQVGKAKVITSNGCNAIIFTNRGVETAYINNEPLETDQSMSINGLQNERDQTAYKVKFSSGGGSKSLYIKKKYYVKPKK